MHACLKLAGLHIFRNGFDIQSTYLGLASYSSCTHSYGQSWNSWRKSRRAFVCLLGNELESNRTAACSKGGQILTQQSLCFLSSCAPRYIYVCVFQQNGMEHTYVEYNNSSSKFGHSVFSTCSVIFALVSDDNGRQTKQTDGRTNGWAWTLTQFVLFLRLS